jgi:hypothetical protein
MLCEISINNLIYEVIKEQNIDCLNKKFLICCDFVKIFFLPTTSCTWIRGDGGVPVFYFHCLMLQ